EQSCPSEPYSPEQSGLAFGNTLVPDVRCPDHYFGSVLEYIVTTADRSGNRSFYTNISTVREPGSGGEPSMGAPKQDRFSFQLLKSRKSSFDRRIFFKIAATGVAGYFVSPLQPMAQTVTTTPGASILGTAKNCIFVLLAGGPSHMDTLDLRVGSWTPKDFAPA